MAEKRVRINVYISADAYAALRSMAGGERSMGGWLNSAILLLYSFELRQSATQRLAAAKAILDNWYERLPDSRHRGDGNPSGAGETMKKAGE